MVRIYLKGAGSGILNPCAKILGFGSAPLNLQIEVTADTVMATARAAEKQVTAAMKASAKANKGKMVGLKYKFKTKDSMVTKIKRELKANPAMNVNNVTTNRLNDSLRYTVQFPEKNYTAGVKNTLGTLKKKGYKVDEVKNYWNPKKAGQGVYKGVNTVVTDPTGKKFELQFHTAKSLDVKERVSHPVYKKLQETRSDKKRKGYIETLRKTWEEDVRVPEGALGI